MTVFYQDIPDQARLEAASGPVGSGGHAGAYRTWLKRLFDFSLVFLTLPVSLSIVLFFAAIVALDGHNPFYSQERVGRKGRVFRIWKLRSMVPDAEARLALYLEQNDSAREEWNATQKLKKDPRITRVGQFIRRSSIDELPQLLNVLTGEMSLVGPRPMMVSQTSLYPGTAYFRIRPGITGYWQISDRNETTFAMRAEYDTRYDQEMSFATDLAILRSTVGVVLRCTGY